jgi:23S rRNA (adenine2503-C2)-methyltransferase
MTPAEIADDMAKMGEKPFRGKQLFRWLHQKGAASFEEMSDLSLSLREKCHEKYAIDAIKMKKRLVSAIDGTVKYLYELSDGKTVEAVLMHYRHGTSLCISTQVGCRMGCTFCASTIGGLRRNLTPAEMLEEVYAANRDLPDQKVDSIVLMGIGEPLDNFENTLRFLELLSHPDGLNMSLRHVSLSTCGLVDRIDQLALHKLGLTLSVSLHAPNDFIRGKTMPINRQWPIDELLAACRRYFAATGRRVSFEYALIEGHNDSDDNARELALRLKGMNCHLNLIPVNAVSGKTYKASRRIERFAAILSGQGITTTIRRTLGADIHAACGQLRREDSVVVHSS